MLYASDTLVSSFKIFITNTCIFEFSPIFLYNGWYNGNHKITAILRCTKQNFTNTHVAIQNLCLLFCSLFCRDGRAQGQINPQQRFDFPVCNRVLNKQVSFRCKQSALSGLKMLQLVNYFNYDREFFGESKIM